MRVRAYTQTRFEELYYLLSDTFNDHAIAARIAQHIGKTLQAVYMYLRRRFHTGTEQYKQMLITAMEQILEECHV